MCINKYLEINIDLVKDLHLKLAGNIFDVAGNFRKTDVRLGNYEPPKYFEIAELMKNWEDDFKERQKFIKNIDDYIELLSWLMHRFLWIHPFFDYNGRISRLLGEIYLLQNNLPVVSFRGMTRNTFSEAMKVATLKNDFSKIIKLIKRDLK
ncbi:Fic family protein [Candidatus Kuenenbacteria bacterium]|nr:Fic family protein [Candidatus Kuenenbacteria bacterium]